MKRRARSLNKTGGRDLVDRVSERPDNGVRLSARVAHSAFICSVMRSNRSQRMVNEVKETLHTPRLA